MEQTRPIDQFMSAQNANVDMLYEAMPYVPFRFKKPLALFLKMQEMQEIAHGFDDSDTLSACGLDEPSHNMEEMLCAMRQKASGNMAAQLDRALSVIQAEKIYRAFQETSNAKTPDMASVLQTMMKGDNDESKLAQ